MAEASRDILLNVSVDVGTIGTCATFTVSVSNDYDAKDATIHRTARHITFPMPDGISYAKIPTYLVLKKGHLPEEREIVAFGHTAQDLFVDAPKEDESDDEHDNNEGDPASTHAREDLLFFGNFKKNIVEAIENPPEDGFIQYDQILVDPQNDECGIRVPVTELLTKFIVAISNYTVEQANRMVPFSVDKDRILWVFTAPALWDEYSRNMLKKCAHDANLRDVVLELEGDASAAWFLQQEKKRQLKVADDDRIEIERRIRYLLFDCGGGTTDCVYHQIQKLADGGTGYEVCERLPGIAKPFGAAVLDDDFRRYLLVPIFGEENLARMKAEHGHLLLGIKRNWFTTLTHAQPGKSRVFKFSDGHLVSQYFDGTIQDVNERLKNLRVDEEGGDTINMGEFKKRGARLKISDDGLWKIHERLLGLLGDFVAQQIALTDDIQIVPPRKRGRRDFVAFVGGFSKSLYLKEYLNRRFSGEDERIKRLFWFSDEHPELSVSVGSLFPQNMTEFRSRSYIGFEFSANYDPRTDGQLDHVVGSGPEAMEVRLFQTIVRKYQKFRPGDEVLFENLSADTSSGPVIFNLFESESDAPPRYVDDPGCSLALSFTLPQSRGNGKIEVSGVLQPGSVEVFVKQDGQKIKCQLRTADSGDAI